MSYAPPSTPATLEVLTGWPALAGIEDAWRALHAQAGGSLFSEFDWLAMHEAAFERAEDLQIALLRQDGHLVAAAPLVAGRAAVSKLLPRYRPATLGLMHCRYSGFQEVLASTPAHAAMLGKALAERMGPCNLDLDVVVDDGPTAAFLRAVEDAGYVALRTPNFTSVRIDGTQGFDAYLAGRSRNLRKALNRASRALDAQGIRFELAERGAPGVLDRVQNVSRRSWKHSAGTGIAAQPGNTAFLRRVLAIGAGPGDGAGGLAIRTGFLTGPESDIAFVIAVLHGGISYVIWSEFDEAQEALSPGRSVIAHLLAHHMEAGEAQVIDLIRQTHFTKNFGEATYTIHRVRAVPRLGASRMLAGTDRLARRLAGAVRTGRRKSIRRSDVREGPR